VLGLELIIQGFGIVIVNKQEILTGLQRFVRFENALMTIHGRECAYVNRRTGCIGLQIAHLKSPVLIDWCVACSFTFIPEVIHLYVPILPESRKRLFALEQTGWFWFSATSHHA
jgi:hypothetical protein